MLEGLAGLVMNLLFFQDQRYDCLRCAKGCRIDWNVHVSSRALPLIRESSLFARVRARDGVEPIEEAEVLGEPATLAVHLADGRCAFLGEDDLCAIHAELGVAAKPLGCRQFPFVLVETPAGVVVGTSFFCSAVQANVGRPVADHARDIEALIREDPPPRVGFDPIPFGESVSVSWPIYEALEAFVLRLLDRPGDVRDALFRVVAIFARAAVDLRARPDADERALLTALSARKGERLVRDALVSELDATVAYSVQTVLDSSPAERRDANHAALVEGGVFESALLGRALDLTDFAAFRARSERRGGDEHLRRYVKQLVFRKFLLRGRTIVANAVAMHVAALLFDLNRDLCAFARGADAVTDADVFHALDVVERGWSLHARGMARFFDELPAVYVNLLGA